MERTEPEMFCFETVSRSEKMRNEAEWWWWWGGAEGRSTMVARQVFGISGMSRFTARDGGFEISSHCLRLLLLILSHPLAVYFFCALWNHQSREIFWRTSKRSGIATLLASPFFDKYFFFQFLFRFFSMIHTSSTFFKFFFILIALLVSFFLLFNSSLISFWLNFEILFVLLTNRFLNLINKWFA